jgi:hypothetical protein
MPGLGNIHHGPFIPVTTTPSDVTAHSKHLKDVFSTSPQSSLLDKYLLLNVFREVVVRDKRS